MNRVRALLTDRKRAQRGSVLSAVLIMVAFLSIISGAVMTELSTNFLLSSVLVNRVANQATVNSAMTLALDRLQNTPLDGGCPTINPLTMNGRTSVVAYSSCFPVVDRGSPSQFTSIASSSSPFGVEGTHAQLAGLNDYVVTDSGGTIFDFPFGQTGWRWKLPLGGSVTTGPVLVMPYPNRSGRYLDVVPVSGTNCSPSTYCVSVQYDSGGYSTPTQQCTIGHSATVVAQPAVGINFANIVFSGDTSGSLRAYDPTAVSGGGCDPEGAPANAGGPIVGGPVVFRCASGCGTTTDEVFVLTSNGSSSQLVGYTYANTTLTRRQILGLPFATASGLAVDGSGLPSRVAITFSGGGVALVNIDANANMTLGPTTMLGAGIASAPYWCHCPGSANLIGVGGQNGVLYVLDTSLNPYATYAGAVSISTSPGADSAGDWYVGADDGYLYEVQVQPGQPAMRLAWKYGSMGMIGSSVQVGTCSNGTSGICIYLGSSNQRAYLVRLDARDVVMTSCVSSAPPACSGGNPRLWAQVEVGDLLTPQTVHVQGWSYYAP